MFKIILYFMARVADQRSSGKYFPQTPLISTMENRTKGEKTIQFLSPRFQPKYPKIHYNCYMYKIVGLKYLIYFQSPFIYPNHLCQKIMATILILFLSCLNYFPLCFRSTRCPRKHARLPWGNLSHKQTFFLRHTVCVWMCEFDTSIKSVLWCYHMSFFLLNFMFTWVLFYNWHPLFWQKRIDSQYFISYNAKWHFKVQNWGCDSMTIIKNTLLLAVPEKCSSARRVPFALRIIFSETLCMFIKYIFFIF